jgi:predicted nucleotidyltransferase
VERAILFGSRAKGTFKPGSDVDLTLLGEGLTTRDLGTIEDELDDLLLPMKMDLSIFEHIAHVPLREHIERVGIDLYRRTTRRTPPTSPLGRAISPTRRRS